MAKGPCAALFPWGTGEHNGALRWGSPTWGHGRQTPTLASPERQPGGFVALGDSVCPQLWPWSLLADLCHHPARGSGTGSWVLVWDPSSWHCGTYQCSGTDAGGRGQQGDLLTLQGLSVPGGPRVLTMGRPQWQPWGHTQEMSPVGVPPFQGPFLLGLPGEGAFPAFPWSDLVSQCQQCAVPAVCPRSQRALAHPHRGSGLPGWCLPRLAAGVVGDKGSGHWHLGRSHYWFLGTQGFPPSLAQPPHPRLSSGLPVLPWFLAGVEQLGCSAGSWRGKHSAVVPSTKPHCSEQIHPESGCIFVK